MTIDMMQDPKRPVSFVGGAANEHPAEQVLRKLACWLGAGGYNAPTVNADEFHDKIVWGIGELVQKASELQLEVYRYRDMARNEKRLADMHCQDGARWRLLLDGPHNLAVMSLADDGTPCEKLTAKQVADAMDAFCGRFQA
jgi:hypothetical protein